MLIALNVTSIIVAAGVSLWLSSWLCFLQTTDQMQSLDDGWLFYHAVLQDVTCARSLMTNGSTLTVVMSSGGLASYRLSPASHLLLRTLNGYGEIVVSTGVDDLHFQTSSNGVVADVKYVGERNDDEEYFSWSTQADAL